MVFPWRKASHSCLTLSIIFYYICLLLFKNFGKFAAEVLRWQGIVGVMVEGGTTTVSLSVTSGPDRRTVPSAQTGLFYCILVSGREIRKKEGNGAEGENREQETLVDEGRCALEEIMSKSKQKPNINVKKKYFGVFFFVSFLS